MIKRVFVRDTQVEAARLLSRRLYARGEEVPPHVAEVAAAERYWVDAENRWRYVMEIDVPNDRIIPADAEQPVERSAS